MVEHLLPISKTNVVTLLNRETTYAVPPTTANTYKQIAFNASSLARQQTLIPNPELRGSRMQGALVVGPKNPGGPVQGYQTDETIVAFYEALYGSRVSTELAAIGLTVSAALAGAGAGLVTTGTHSYKIVITKGVLGYTLPSVVSGIVTTDTSTDGKVNVSRTGGALPSGWTWDIYRTIAGNTGAWKLVNPSPLGAAAVSYLDNIADGSLGANAPSSSTAGDYSHLITIANILPSYTIERSMPYINDAAQFIRGVGCKIDTGKIQLKSTGYFDLQSNWLTQGVTTHDVSVETGTPIDWRFGEKLHQAMIGAGMVKVGPSLDGLGGLADFGKFLDVTFDHNNNLDKTDYPLGLSGDRGSLTELQAISTVSGTIKVTEPSALDFLQSAPALQLIQIEHELATFGHTMTHRFYGCQLDPMDPPVAGQGILTAGFTAHAVQDPTSGLQAEIIIVNGVPGPVYYDANA